MKWKNTVVAVFFVLATLACSGLLATSFLGEEGQLESLLKTSMEQDDPRQILSGAESAINRDLDRYHFFIQLYGASQRLIGRSVIVDMADPAYSVIKQSDGSLVFEHLGSQPVDVTAHAQAVVEFAQALDQEFGLPLLYIQAPQKADQDKLPGGVTDYGNGYADKMLELLRESDAVDTLDLRPEFHQLQAESESPFFFYTDHHWTPEGGFVGYQILARYLRDSYGFPIDLSHTDPDNYEKIVYEDLFLGSQGKRVGTWYAGVDDITLWKPKFDTDFTYLAPLYAIERHGAFEEALLFPERVEEVDYFGGNPYTLYSGGDYNMARIFNHLNPDGKRILLIRDSFACVLAPFLALDCSELITVDLRYFDEDLMPYIQWLQPDLVCIQYAASSTRLPEIFQFFGAEAKPGYRY